MYNNPNTFPYGTSPNRNGTGFLAQISSEQNNGCYNSSAKDNGFNYIEGNNYGIDNTNSNGYGNNFNTYNNFCDPNDTKTYENFGNSNSKGYNINNNTTNHCNYYNTDNANGFNINDNYYGNGYNNNFTDQNIKGYNINNNNMNYDNNYKPDFSSPNSNAYGLTNVNTYNFPNPNLNNDNYNINTQNQSNSPEFTAFLNEIDTEIFNTVNSNLSKKEKINKLECLIKKCGHEQAKIYKSGMSDEEKAAKTNLLKARQKQMKRDHTKGSRLSCLGVFLEDEIVEGFGIAEKCESYCDNVLYGIAKTFKDFKTNPYLTAEDKVKIEQINDKLEKCDEAILEVEYPEIEEADKANIKEIKKQMKENHAFSQEILDSNLSEEEKKKIIRSFFFLYIENLKRINGITHAYKKDESCCEIF